MNWVGAWIWLSLVILALVTLPWGAAILVGLWWLWRLSVPPRDPPP